MDAGQLLHAECKRLQAENEELKKQAPLFCCPACGEDGKIERSYGGLACTECTFNAASRATWNQEAFEYLVRELIDLKKEMKEAYEVV
jgi:ribosomal protein L37AE/L43A